MAVVGLFVAVLWCFLRLVRCEACGIPFSVPGALYRVVMFEGLCRRCGRDEPSPTGPPGHGRRGGS